MAKRSAARGVRLESLTNVLTIASCLIVCALALSTLVQRSKDSVEHLPPGAPMPIIDGFQRGASDALILGVRSACRYCTDSMPEVGEIVRVLSPLVQDGKLRVVVVSPDPPDVLGDYLRAGGLGSVEQARVGAASPLVRATPSVVIAGRDGRIRASWIGLIDHSRASEILHALK